MTFLDKTFKIRTEANIMFHLNWRTKVCLNNPWNKKVSYDITKLTVTYSKILNCKKSGS